MKDHWERFYGDKKPDSDFQRECFNKWTEQGILTVEKIYWDVLSGGTITRAEDPIKRKRTKEAITTNWDGSVEADMDKVYVSKEQANKSVEFLREWIAEQREVGQPAAKGEDCLDELPENLYRGDAGFGSSGL